MENNASPLAPVEFRPQPGPQERFMGCAADIAIYGGAAGGGKTYAALMEPLRHMGNGQFEGVIFRRTMPQIKQPGGLLSESQNIYPHFGGKVNLTDAVWQFPSGMRVKLAHLQHEKTRLEWQGSQVALVIFEELTHFTSGQFWYLISRLRSTCGVRPYLRGTCNPDPDSFVAELVEWWIDQETGLPIPERSGALRWFVRDGESLLWADSPEELRALVPHWGESLFRPKSLTFIAASVYDNVELLEKDPDYLANLMALSLVEREQLLGGNWKIRPSAGLMFKSEWFETVDAAPADAKYIRIWDFAGTVPGAGGDPDWTVGMLLGKTPTNLFYVADVVRLRVSPHAVETALKNTALQDGRRVKVLIPQDPAQAGKFQANHFTRLLAGFDVGVWPQSGSKTERAKPASAQAEAGNIKIVRGAWNRDFLRELENFPDGAHDDQVDPLAGGMNYFTGAKSKKLVSH